MKKFIAMIMAVALMTMSLVGMAHAETRFAEVRERCITNLETGEVVDSWYEALITTEYCGEEIWIEIGQKAYDAYLAEVEAEKIHHDNLWYVKASNWCANAATDVADFVVFWN